MKQMDTTSQDKIVLWHMTKHKYITSFEAFSLYGITRLSAKIYNLRQDGWKIGLVWETGTNRYGNPVKWGKYYIEKTPNKRGK